MAVSDFRKRLDEDLKKKSKASAGSTNNASGDSFDLKNRFNTAKKVLAPSISADLYNSAYNLSDKLQNDMYKMGGNQQIHKGGIIGASKGVKGEAEYYKKLYQANPGFFKQYMGEDVDWDKYFENMSEDTIRVADDTITKATARTGGLSYIDTSGMKKAEVNALGRMDKLSRRDDIYAALQQDSGVTQKPNIAGTFESSEAYSQYIASGEDPVLNELLKERRTYDDYRNMYANYPEEAMRKDIQNVWSYNTERNVNGTTQEEYEAARRRVYAATGKDYGAIAEQSGSDIAWTREAMDIYKNGQQNVIENIFGGMSETEYNASFEAAMNELNRAGQKGKKLDDWEEQADRATNKQLNAFGSDIDYYRPQPMYLNIDPTYLEGHREYQYEDGTYMPADEFRKNAINEWMMAYVNAGGDEAKIAELDKIRGEYLPEVDGYNLDRLKYLTDDQKRALFIAYNNDDQETVDSLLETYRFGLDFQRASDMEKEWAAKYAGADAGEKVGMNIQSIGQNVGTALEGVKQAVWSIAAPEELKKISEYDPVYDKTRKANITRQMTGEEIALKTEGTNIPWTDRNLWAAIYQGVMSGADSVAISTSLAPLGPVGQAAAMAGITYANERMNKLEAGYSNADANMDAWINAAIEGISEYIPFDIMGKNSPSMLRKGLAGAVAEGLGESASEIGSGLYEEIKYGTGRDELLTQGYDNNNLWFEWLKTQLPDVAEAFVGGVAGGAGSTTVSSIRDSVQNRRVGKTITANEGTEALASLADTLPVSKQAKAIVERMKADRTREGGEDTDKVKSKKYKPVSHAEVGYVFRQTMQNVDKQAQMVVEQTFSRDVVEQALKDAGYKGNVKQAARTATAFIGGKYTRDIISKLEQDSVLRDITLGFTEAAEDMRAYARSEAANVANYARKDFVKPEATKAEKGAEEATKGIEDRAVITAADVEIADTPESTVDGQAVTIEGVAKVSDIGTVTYTVKDSEGNTREVSEDDVSIGQNDAVTAVLVENARELGRNADAMIRSYVNGQDVQAYAEAFKQALQYGEDGRNLDVVKGYSDMKALNEGQIATAYEIGRGRRTFRNTRMVRKNTAGIKVGNVDTSQINMHDLNTQQMESVRSMSSLAKAVGFNLKFVESKADAEGRYTTENGSWDPETLTLTLDVHAGSNKANDKNYAMMHTAGHELTHYIKQFADGEMWNAYQEFVIGHLSTKDGKGFDLENAITAHIKTAREQGRYLDRDAAIEEVIANASGDALNKITEADMSALAQDNPGLFNKIKAFFDKWIRRLRERITEAYKGAEARTEEAQQMMDAVDEMGRRWNELLLNATKNRRKSAKGENVASEATTEGVEVSESGDIAYVDSETLYSLRTFNESDYVTERDKAAAALAKRMGVTQEKAERYIDDVTSIAAMVAKDRDRLDFESEDEYTALKHNSEYKFTVDFSTLCKKRLLYTGTFDAIQKQMPETALTEDDYIRLRQMMADRGYEVACAFCYVESRRKNNGEIINKFLEVYKNAQKTGGQMELGPSNRRKAFSVEEGFTPNIADFNTSEGIANIMHNHRGVYDAYMYFMNARGVSKPKLIESRTAYNSEILKKFRSVSAVRSMNRRGGLRLQSFSDFEVVNMLDMMQVVMDMSRVGLMSQAYTKVPAFARAFGGTGVKINLSLVTKGVDKNGKLIFDDIEGMPHEEAFKIRDMYSENVGTILVGKDDETIRAAMADPRIDFIIPYHASGWSTENQNALGIGGYTNFTAGQNETNAATGRGVKNFQPSEYWDYSKTGDENAQIYLEKCREAGRVPKFPQYQNYPGYWKMLIDFKMYDNEGNGSPQRPVRPDFNLSEAGRIMKEYTGGHQNLPVAHDVVRDFVKEKQKQGSEATFYDDRKKYSMRDTEGTVLSPQQAEYFKDSKAVDDEGNLLVLYHGTRAGTQISVFKTTEEYRKGLYLTDIPKVAEGFASKVVGRNDDGSFKYADIKNVTKANFDDYDFETSGVYKMYANIKNPYVVYAGYAYYYNIPTPDEMRSGNYGSTVDTQEINAWAYEHGYDGVIVKNVREGSGDYPGTDVIVFDKNQVKFADNDEPTESDDIRYQSRDLSNLSDRELLVRALDTELTPDERDHLESYKAKMDKLSEDQRKLEALNSEIVQLRQAGKTQKNSEELRKAMTNATTLRGRIDRTDAELNKIESAAMIKEIVRRNRAEASRSKATSLREWQEKEKYRKMLVTDAKKLHKWIVSPTSKGYTPEFMREPVAKFLETVDFTSKRALGGGDDTWNDQKFKDALEELRDAIGKLGNQQSDIDGGAQSFMGYIDLPANYVQNFNENISAIRKALDVGGRRTDTPVNRMTAAQMRELAQAFRVLNSSIVKVNTLVSNARYSSAKLAADETIDDMNELRARRKTNKAFEVLNTTFNWKNATPYNAFQRMGRGAKAIFESLQDGWDKLAQNIATVIEFSRDTFTAKESRTWAKEISEVKLDNGETIQMTTAQKMSLYCLSKRPQATGHLLGGGIRVADIEGKRGSKISQAENYTLTLDDIGRITGSLTDRQKEVADALQRFMSDQCAKWGNEISMKRFGFNQMTELFYFPIETDSNNRARIDETKDGKNSMFRLLNMSSLKPLTPNANNAIVIHDIFDVFAGHASDMAKYNALALPILDFIKWYNHVERTEVRGDDGKTTGQITTRSTQKALERAFGQDAKSYLTAFIKDLNAEHDGGRNDGLINSIVGRAKSAAVGWNLRVYGLQITSLPRAAYAINPVYLAKGLAKVKSLNPVNAIKGTEAQQKVGILKWKDLGFYSTDIGRSTRGMVKRDEGILGKIRDWSMAPAGWGDNWVSNIIYEAAKAEMKAKNPEIKPGSAEYDRRLNKRVREIVYKTQVVDSTMTRSDFMRSKGLASTLTAFMSESTLTVNMLNESIQKAVETARKGGNVRDILRASGGMAVRAASTWVFTSVVTTLMESMFDALRDDDEYETFLQKFWSAIWGDKWYNGNAVQNLNPITMFPILNEAWSIMVEGYEDNSLITQVFSQFRSFFDAIRSYQKGNTTLYNVIYKGAQTVSSMSGHAVGNAMRDFVSMYNTFLAPAWGTPKLQTYEDNETTAATAYYEAVKAGDTERAEYYRERMDVTGMDMAKVEKKLATLAGDDFVSGGMTEAEARKWLTSEGGYDSEKADTKMRDLNFKKETGVNYSDFKSAYVAGTISKSEATRLLKKYREYDDNQVYFTLQEWEGGEDWTKYGNFLDAVDAQGNYVAEGQKLLDHGVDKSDIARAISTAYKDAYREIHGTYEGNRLLEYLLDVYEAIGYDRDYERRYITKNWLKD